MLRVHIARQSIVPLRTTFPRITTFVRIPQVQQHIYHKMASSGSQIPVDKPADPYKAKNLDKDTPLKEKLEDLFAIVDSSKIGMMTTRTSDGLLVSRAMAVAGRENGVDLVFTTNTETGKTTELDKEPHVNVAFYNGLNGEWVSISGQAELSNERSKVHKYYSPTLKAWLGDLGDGQHDGGPDDPRIGVIIVKATTATYMVSKVSMVTKAYELAKGVITGEAPQVNTLREVSEAELRQGRTLIPSKP